MRKMYQRSEPTERYKMPQGASASMRQELFDKTAVSFRWTLSGFRRVRFR